MAVLLVLVGLLAVIVTGGVALFTVGTIPAAVVMILIVALVGYALFAAKALRTAVLAGVGAVLLVALGYGGLSAYQLYGAFGNFDGAADPADPVALAAANAKLDAAQEQNGFNVELTEEELGAVLQDTLTESEDNPIRRVDLTIVDGEGDEPGYIDFEVTFKSGSLTGDGRIGASLDAGQIDLEIHDVSLGRLSLPGIATGAMEDLVDTVLDLNERLAESKADIQSLEVGQGRVKVVGTQNGGELLTAGGLLSAIASNVESLSGAVTPPAEVIGAGTVNGTSADGASYIVAIGDSLSANVGVPSANGGMVSRFHKVVSESDGSTYGLRNFGISGETSGTIITGGQLNEALAFMRDNEVAYVTVSIGANDLLGHVASDDCAEDLDTPSCQERLEPSLAAFRANFDRILGDVDDASGDAVVIVLSIYNPFSLGFGGNLGLEASSNEATEALNAVLEEVAAAHGALVADGYTPMQGTTAATTHMLDNPPDVHPNSAGYDLLAQALAAAIR